MKEAPTEVCNSWKKLQSCGHPEVVHDLVCKRALEMSGAASARRFYVE